MIKLISGEHTARHSFTLLLGEQTESNYLDSNLETSSKCLKAFKIGHSLCFPERGPFQEIMFTHKLLLYRH